MSVPTTAPTRRTPLRAAALAVAALTLALLTAACGGSGDAKPSTAHNAADVTFAQQMIPHHRQAVQMAAMAETHNAGSQVRALARKIQDAQGPEIKKMSSWLEAWGEQVPSATDQGSDGQGSGDQGSDDQGMGGMSGGAMEGMMSAQDMTELSTARGAAFDDLFLTQMIEHHTGAVSMAEKEQADGKAAEAVDLAGSIEKGQTAEITQMKKLLATG